MASKGQLTGMVGVYLVAAMLSRRGFIASPTSRNARGVDLLVADPRSGKTFSVEVKTNASTFGFWLLGKGASELKSGSLIYALVNLRETGTEFYLVPSRVIARHIKISLATKTRKSTWYSIHLPKVEKYKDNWGVFGRPGRRPA